MKKKLILSLIILSLSLSLSFKAQSDVLVVRDVVDSPTINDIIKNIISSIEEFVPRNIHVYTDKEFVNLNSFEKSIAIGDNSISLVEELNDSVDKIYIGSMQPKEIGYSFAFTPSPKDVVNKIKNIFPYKKQIYIVSSERVKWIDKHYKKYFEENDIKVNFYYASSLRSSIEHYKNILSEINNENSLLFLTENSLVDEDAILPYILNKSWDDDVVVISTKASHVKYGVLMSFVPDIKNFGKQVNKCLLTECTEIENIDGFNVATPLVNKRMYKHLELNFNNDVIFLE